MVPVSAKFDTERDDATVRLVNHIIRQHASEATEAFGVLVAKSTGPDISKVILCGQHMHLCVKKQNVFVLFRDTVLDVRVLISMWDAVPVRITKITFSALHEVMRI